MELLGVGAVLQFRRVGSSNNLVAVVGLAEPGMVAVEMVVKRQPEVGRKMSRSGRLAGWRLGSACSK
ncbi:MAG TPA: hypothetical protein VFN35_30570 [Ktedonobacteraceae bacterium]|nr:hypothetical protein [Ktedonobacteraceae bacterium]